jgi:DNA repair metallo-beta-lactamase
VPTGWVDSGKCEGFRVVEKVPWKIHLIPYSEHSSFPELQEFVAFLKPKRIVPTVGAGGEEGERRVRKMLEHFRHLTDTTSAKRSFLSAFGSAAARASGEATAVAERGGAGVMDGAEEHTAAEAAHGAAEDAESPVGISAAEARDHGIGGASAGRPAGNGASASAALLDTERVRQVEQAVDLASSPDGAAAASGAAPAQDAAPGLAPISVTKESKPPSRKGVSAPSVPAVKSAGQGGAVQQLRVLLGSDMSYGEALRLLQSSQGSVAAAANAHFAKQAGEGTQAAQIGPAQLQQPAERDATLQLGGAAAGSAAANDLPSAAAIGAANTTGKTATGSKTTKPNTVPANGNGTPAKRTSSKRSGPSPAKQATAITSFFGKSAAAAAAGSAGGKGEAAVAGANDNAAVPGIEAEEQLLARVSGTGKRKSGNRPAGPPASADELSSSDDGDAAVGTAQGAPAQSATANGVAGAVAQADGVGDAEGGNAAGGSQEDKAEKGAGDGQAHKLGLVGGQGASEAALENALLPVDKCALVAHSCVQACAPNSFSATSSAAASLQLS